MPSTYTPIATTTLGSSAASITFSSIAGTYTDLIMVFNGVANNNVSLRFNSDSGTNYSVTRMQGNGSSASSTRFTSATSMLGSYDSGRSTSIWQIMNYSNSTTYKTALNRGGGTVDNVEAYVGLWRNTAAITSVTVIVSGTFSSGSTFNLYGVKSA
jgi:hypothetical protein